MTPENLGRSAFGENCKAVERLGISIGVGEAASQRKLSEIGIETERKRAQANHDKSWRRVTRQIGLSRRRKHHSWAGVTNRSQIVGSQSGQSLKLDRINTEPARAVPQKNHIVCFAG